MGRFAVPILVGIGLFLLGSSARKRRRKKAIAPAPEPEQRLPPPVPKPEDMPVEDVDNEWAPFRDLADAQEALNLLGFPVEVSDAWTPETEGAVQAFQKHVNGAYGMGLAIDGEPDPQTLDALAGALDALTRGEWIFPEAFLEGETTTKEGRIEEGRAESMPQEMEIQPARKKAAMVPVDKETIVTHAFWEWWTGLSESDQTKLKTLLKDPFTKVVDAYTEYQGQIALAEVVTQRLAVMAPAILADPDEDDFAAALFDQLIAFLTEDQVERFYMILVEAVSPAEDDWPVDPEETTWSDQLYVSPDCSAVIVGGFWPKNRLTPRVMSAAKSIQDHNVAMPPEIVLDSLLGEDAPECVDAGYEQWGEPMRQWYDHWVAVIAEELKVYAQHPELLEEG